MRLITDEIPLLQIYLRPDDEISRFGILPIIKFELGLAVGFFGLCLSLTPT
jgi:hypothetical protein